jgi:nickel transport protein
LVLTLVATPVFAHGIQVFAFADGDRIEGSAYFAGGGVASGAHIRVLDAEGGLLAQLEPDAEGAFSYRARAPVDHLIVAETGDGHRAEWRVSAAELGPGFPTAAAQGSASEGGVAGRSFADPSAQSELTALIEQAVARQVRPLREELLAAQGRASLRDVLGGIGYLFGLAGVLMWGRCRGSRDLK